MIFELDGIFSHFFFKEKTTEIVLEKLHFLVVSQTAPLLRHVSDLKQAENVFISFFRWELNSGKVGVHEVAFGKGE